MGLFDSLKLNRLKEGLTKTRDNLFGKIQNILSGSKKIDDETINKIEEILIEGDVGVSTTEKIISDIRNMVKKEGYEVTKEIENIFKSEIKKLLEKRQGSPGDQSVSADDKPHAIMIVGVNGVGKTTTIGKLAYNYKNSGKEVLIGAADTFRAAANEQLEIWAERAGVEIIQQPSGADPAAVAYDALKAAVARRKDILIVDTAGRLHTKINLMEELKKIKRVMQKIDAKYPQETLLVLDASTGQNAIQQAKQFASAVGVTGLILTKLDGTAKGGVVIAISSELNIPVKYIGVGENIDDLQPFDSQAFVNALFGK